MPSFIVPPLATTVAAFKPRPSITQEEQSKAKRNLFGSPDPSDIDKRLHEENTRMVHKMMERYSFDITKLEDQSNSKQQISADEPKTQMYIVKAGLKLQRSVPKNSVKRIFAVRKNYNRDLRVPKRKNNRISNEDVEADCHNSEMGPNGEKRMCKKGCRNNNCNN